MIQFPTPKPQLPKGLPRRVLGLEVGSWKLSLSPHLNSSEPTVKAAPDTMSNRSPRLSAYPQRHHSGPMESWPPLCCQTVSMLMTTFSSGTPSLPAAERMMRRLA